MRLRFIEPARWTAWCLNTLAYKEVGQEAKATNIAKLALALLAGLMLPLATWYNDRERYIQLACCPANLQDIQRFLNYWYGYGNVSIVENNEQRGMYAPINNDADADPIPAEYQMGDGSLIEAPFLQLSSSGSNRRISAIYQRRWATPEVVSQLEGDMRILLPFWVQYDVVPSNYDTYLITADDGSYMSAQGSRVVIRNKITEETA